MSKISNQSAYPAATPVDGDYLIGTDISDSNATKTFTVGSIVALTPADTLAEVLAAGNTATNNIVLTGNITCTTIIPTDIQDAAGNTGTVGQHLVKNAANALEWGAGSADTLANVLAAGNSAANAITLTGATGIITSTVSVPTDIRDNAGNFGTAGQTLKKSAANALAWETVGDNTLAEVLAAGNTATNNIILTGDISSTNLTASTLVSTQTVEATVSVSPNDIVDSAAATGTAGQYLRKSAANALAWETVGNNTLSEVLTAGNTATNDIILTGYISLQGAGGTQGIITVGKYAEIIGAVPLKMTNTTAYADDAAAGAAGLGPGDVYQTDGTAAAPLNVAGILMIKQ